MAVILDKLVRRFKAANLSQQTLKEAGFLPFVVAGHAVGWVHASSLDILRNWPSVFLLDAAQVRLSPSLESAPLRTQFLQKIAAMMAEHQCIPPLQQRGIGISAGQTPLFAIDCSAAPFFGVEVPVAYLSVTSASQEGPVIWLKRQAGPKGALYDMVVQDVVLLDQDFNSIFNDVCLRVGITTGMAEPTGEITTCRVTQEGLVRCRIHTYELAVDEQVQLVQPVSHAAQGQFERMSLQQARELLVSGDKIGLEGSLVLAELLKRYGWVKQLPNGLWMSS